MTWQGVCAVCGGPVKGGTDNGTLDLPADGQKVICLACLDAYLAGAGQRNPVFVAAFRARRDVRRGGRGVS